MTEIHRPQENCIIIHTNRISFSVPGIILMLREGNMKHTRLTEAKEGDRIVSLIDGCTYDITGRRIKYSYEYGGTTYVWPYYSIQSEGIEEKMFYGEYSSHTQLFYPVLVQKY